MKRQTYHVNCPVWEGNGHQGMFPKIMADKCIECTVDISGLEPVTITHVSKSVVYYTIQTADRTIEIATVK